MCRADLDPPRSDGLLCRIVGVAFRARTTHKHRIGESIKPWPISRARVRSVARFPSNISDRVGKEASGAWRDHLLKQVVDYLGTHRNAIIESFEVENAYNLKREDIEQSDLLDFDVAVTLHRDQSPSFGLGFGFFKANMIR